MIFQRKVSAIPKPWLTKVSEILKRGNGSEIEWTAQGFRRWQLHGTRSEAYEAMLRSLTKPGVTGKRINMPINEGETYAFFFTAKHDPMYGKICLKTGGLEIIIYSAHVSEKDQL